jgi:hypothetical protein
MQKILRKGPKVGTKKIARNDIGIDSGADERAQMSSLDVPQEMD